MTHSPQFRDTVDELSSLLSLLAVLATDSASNTGAIIVPDAPPAEENSKIMVDKKVIPTLLELLNVEEKKLNYQAAAIAGLLASHYCAAASAALSAWNIY